MKDNRQRLFEVLGKIDPTFKPKAELLKEWNFDKKKGDVEKDEDKKEDKDSEKKKFNFDKKEDKSSEKKKFNFDKKEDKESKEHEASETPEEEKKEHEDKEELKEADTPTTKKPPIVQWDKVKAGGK